FADIDADHGDRGTGCLGHGVLLVLAPLASLSLAGQEHGRTIPIADIAVIGGCGNRRRSMLTS
ncbi:hypothetical protein, partial [Bradyrhizobium diazoefficiens]